DALPIYRRAESSFAGGQIPTMARIIPMTARPDMTVWKSNDMRFMVTPPGRSERRHDTKVMNLSDF
ncbi:MAG: hypothetical protein AB7U35_11855, partial [Sphingobium sp.]